MEWSYLKGKDRGFGRARVLGGCTIGDLRCSAQRILEQRRFAQREPAALSPSVRRAQKPYAKIKTFGADHAPQP